MSCHEQSFRRAASTYPVTILCTALLAILAQPALAQAPVAAAVPSTTERGDAVLKFALPAEPLAETLRAIGQQSGRSVQFDASDLVGIQAPPIKGKYTPVAALQKAVAGTVATMSASPGGGWTVFVPKKLRAVVVTANINEAETGFQATRSDTATRSGSDLMDLPESMTIITSDVMQSQQATSVLSVLQDVSGVQTTAETQGPAGLGIRGLGVTTLSNGLANPFATNTNVAGIQSIEVLKGPQAILSGGDSLGGAVNIVTKKPSADPIADLTLQDGTFGDKTATADFSDALADDGKLSGRVIGSWTRAATSDAKFTGRHDNYFMPEIRWKDGRTDFIVGVSYDKEFDPLGRYTFGLNGSIGPVPTMRLGNKDSGVTVTTRSVFYSLEYRFAPWLTVVSRFHRDRVDDNLNLWLGEFPLDIPSMTLAFMPNINVQPYGTTSTDNYLRFSFRTGPFQHVLSTGVNTTTLNYTENEYGLPNFASVQVYADQQYDFPYVSADPSNLQGVNHLQEMQVGAYAQDLVTFGNFHAMLNLRRSYYSSGPDDSIYPQYGSMYTTPKSDTYRTTPGAGLVYNITPDVSVYGAFSEGFTPNFSTTQVCGTQSTNALPQTSRNAEVGAKFASPDGLFSLTAGAFNLNQENVAQYNQALNCNYLIKGARTRGLEMDAQGQLTKGWKLIANVTHNTYAEVGSPGILAAGSPRNQFNVWTTYDFQGGPLHGFGIGGGITAYSSSYINYEPGGYPMNPGGARVDLSAYYRWKKHWLATLGVKNVFDRTLYGVSFTPLFIPVQTGRTTMFTVKYNLL